mmetsp:Transcript_2287/g.3487  ORF Transcript_2287/g.3487 Transcript_2287/m.3487 type:complete len:242 (-) Transcript_2287:99-824(-)
MGAQPATKEDFLAMLTKRIDGDNDGKVTHGELVDHAMKKNKQDMTISTEEDLQEWDTNKDGKISWDELKVGMAVDEEDTSQEAQTEQDNMHRKFLAADGDSDGLLDKDELNHFFFPAGNEKVLKVDTENELRILDKDGDGKLTKEEFIGEFAADQDDAEAAAKAEAEFDQLDVNKDGFIDVHEFKDLHTGVHYVRHTMKEFLDLLDGNKDGHVTVEEAETHFDDATDHEAMHLWFSGNDEL